MCCHVQGWTVASQTKVQPSLTLHVTWCVVLWLALRFAADKPVGDQKKGTLWWLRFRFLRLALNPDAAWLSWWTHTHPPSPSFSYHVSPPSISYVCSHVICGTARCCQRVWGRRRCLAAVQSEGGGRGHPACRIQGLYGHPALLRYVPPHEGVFAAACVQPRACRHVFVIVAERPCGACVASISPPPPARCKIPLHARTGPRNGVRILRIAHHALNFHFNLAQASDTPPHRL